MAESSGGRYAALRGSTSNESSEEEEKLEEIRIPSGKNREKTQQEKQRNESASGDCERDTQTHSSNMAGAAKTSPTKKKKKKKKRKKISANIGFFTSQFDSTSPNPTDKRKKSQDEEGSSTGSFQTGSEASLLQSTNAEEMAETHTEGASKSLQSESEASLPKLSDEKNGDNTKIPSPESNASLPQPTNEEARKIVNQEGEDEASSTRIIQSESNVSLPKPTDEERMKTHAEEGKDEDASTGILLSESNASLPQPTDEKGTKAHEEEGARRFEASETAVEALPKEERLTDLERFTNEPVLPTREEKESQNLLKVFKLMRGVGLNALRKLFMNIHPIWSNTPADASNMERGSMRLRSQESASFNKGDINQWDVSLMTTVLLHSKKCKAEISKRPGFKDAIRKIKDYRNNLSHLAINADKLSDADYQVYWSAISGSLETIGVSKEEIDAIHEGDVFEDDNVYRDLFLQELAAQSAVVEEIRQNRMVDEKRDTIYNEKLDTIIANQMGSSPSENRNQLSPQRGGPSWDEWMKFCDNVRNFEDSQNNYLLITDAMAPELMECFSALRNVPWKIVLDFDPSSEEKGMYKDFTSEDGNSLVNMITPAEIGKKPLADLPRLIDANKTQWMFVNGRENDGAEGGPQDFEDWEDNAAGDISTFFRCCSEPVKLDKNKPLVCLMLPFREDTVRFIDVTIKRLLENFKEFNLNFVGISPQEQSCTLPHRVLKKIKIHTTDLEPQLLRQGIEDLFDSSSEQTYCMPTCQANVPTKLPKKEYLFLSEYLDVLYEGCEDLSSTSDDGEECSQKSGADLIEEHKKSFMSGNWISFVSLYYNHDARREIGKKIRTHIQRLLDQEGLTNSTIVEISHSPGSGGSTIARRVMWDIHEDFPCAFAKLEDHEFDLEDDEFLESLAERISTLEEICHKSPVILLDGKHARIESLSNKLVRILNCRRIRAVLLRCNHTMEESKARSPIMEYSDVHATFSVNVRLEESRADLKEFESKYKDYIKKCKNIRSLSDLSRVFHFPLFAMLKEFRSKLQEIIYESFDEMTDIEKEVVTIVAFIQKFAAQPVPAPLLYAIFQQPIEDRKSSSARHDSQGITYEDISTIMTERLCNLMVPANPAKFIYSGRLKRPNYFQKMYTLQHPVVAEMVLQKAKIALKRDTLALARDFLSFPIFGDIRFIPLIKDLFVLHGCGQGKFSVLFEELKALHPHEAGDVFSEAADQTKDVVVVTSAARYFAKVPPQSFTKAKELIDKAFECEHAEEKQKTIHDVKGVVLLKELQFLAKSGKIASLQKLVQLANETLRSFRNARTSPVQCFPNPLIGEVKTWVTCIEWITKNVYNGNSSMTLHFIMYNAPPFFQGCVNYSFYLLDIVDDIVQTVRSLSNPGKTQREANSVRLSLMKALENIHRPEGRNASEIIQECSTLCSAEMFQSSSQMELKRLQVQYVFSCVKNIENIDKRELEYLLNLLKDIVEIQQDEVFANHLMRICVLLTGPQEYSLDQGLAICKLWNRKSNYDALPHFYEMMIYFLKILDGNVMEFRASYLNALAKCREKSRHNCRNAIPTHFLSKTRTAGMSRLMTKYTLFRGERHDAAYWNTARSREKLLECCGRIRSRSSGGRRSNLTVELMPGNIEIYVAESAEIGRADRNFVPGSLVYFVVSFNLLGPVANGITFDSACPSSR